MRVLYRRHPAPPSIRQNHSLLHHQSYSHPLHSTALYPFYTPFTWTCPLLHPWPRWFTQSYNNPPRTVTSPAERRGLIDKSADHDNTVRSLHPPHPSLRVPETRIISHLKRLASTSSMNTKQPLRTIKRDPLATSQKDVMKEKRLTGLSPPGRKSAPNLSSTNLSIHPTSQPSQSERSKSH
jgi:hypothetical protein